MASDGEISQRCRYHVVINQDTIGAKVAVIYTWSRITLCFSWTERLVAFAFIFTSLLVPVSTRMCYTCILYVSTLACECVRARLLHKNILAQFWNNCLYLSFNFKTLALIVYATGNLYHEKTKFIFLRRVKSEVKYIKIICKNINNFS